MGMFGDWGGPVWTGLEVAFHPTDLNVGEDKALAYHEGYDSATHDASGQFGNDFGQDNSGAASSGDMGS